MLVELRDYSSTFHVRNMNSGNPVVYLLREQFESFAVTPNGVDALDLIASSLSQLGQLGEAGSWYEAAGRLMLAREELRVELRAMYALEDYEKALECYRQNGDAEAEAKCSALLGGLRRVCAPA